MKASGWRVEIVVSVSLAVEEVVVVE